MKIAINHFRGEVPRADSRALAAGWARVASDCKLWNTQLRPWREMAQAAQLPITDAQTIYRAFGEAGDQDSGAWLHWPDVVSVVRGPVANGLERTFFTGDGVPKVTDRELALSYDDPEIEDTDHYPLRARPLGVAAPATAPVAARVAGPTSPVAKTHTYTVHYVQQHPRDSGIFYEGRAQLRELTIQRMTFEKVTLSNLPVWKKSTRQIDTKRIYRTTTMKANVVVAEQLDDDLLKITLDVFHALQPGDSVILAGFDASAFNGTFTVSALVDDEPDSFLIESPAPSVEEVDGPAPDCQITYPATLVVELPNEQERWIDSVTDDVIDPVQTIAVAGMEFITGSTMTFTLDGNPDLAVGQFILTTGSDVSGWNGAHKITAIPSRSPLRIRISAEGKPSSLPTLGTIKVQYAQRDLYVDRSGANKLPRPNAKFTLVENFESVGEADELLRSYVATFVAQWGGVAEDSAPSPVSLPITILPGDAVQVSNLPQPTAPHFVTHIDIYRTASDGVSTNFYFLARVPVGTTSYVDSLPDERLGEALSSTGYYPPPADLHSLISLSNGMLLGASVNRVCVSEPFRPHAWNPLNQLTLPYPIVGMGYFETTVVALTEKNAHLVTGASPAYLSEREIPLNQGCVSRRSIVSAPDGVYYASPDGLMCIGVNGPRLVTSPFFTRDEWRELNPQSLLGCVFEGHYFGFYENNEGAGGFVLDLNPDGTGFTRLGFYAQAVFADPLSDYLYLLDYDTIYRFDAGEVKQPYSWRSAALTLPQLELLTCGRVLADSYRNLTMTVFSREPGGHWREHCRVPVLNSQAQRLPPLRSREFAIGLQGTDAISAVELAGAVTELVL